MKKSILITGSNGGIGQSLCKVFNSHGYFVIATDRHKDSRCNCDAYIQIDLEHYTKNRKIRSKLIDFVENKNKIYPLYGVINNAAYQVTKGINEISVDDVLKTYVVNLFSPLFIIQDLMQILNENNGSIINISSIHANLTKAKFSLYASSKAALSAFTRSLAIEIGENVRVNAIEPGAIDTEMLKEGFKGKIEKYEALKSYQPLQRIGKPEDVAKLALNMINDYTYMNGACIKIDGGISACLHDPD